MTLQVQDTAATTSGAEGKVQGKRKRMAATHMLQTISEVGRPFLVLLSRHITIDNIFISLLVCTHWVLEV